MERADFSLPNYPLSTINTMANLSFPYKALDSSKQEIRLLLLQPAGSLPDEVACNITHAWLTNSPCYETISYVWGEPIFPQRIILEGRPFHITTNLSLALRHLRHVDRPRTLWIDAVCIDQSNNMERGQQVTFMGDIYAAAVINTAWLGPPTLHSDVAFELVIGMSTKYHLEGIATPRHTKEMDEVEGSALSSEIFVTLGNLPAEDWNALEETFAKRVLWKRVWIVQEIALAQVLMLKCGRHEMKWEQLQIFWRVVVFWYKRVLRISTSSPATLTMLPSSFLHDQRMSVAEKFSGEQSSLTKLWYTFHRWNATDPRDKLFALLGLARDGSLVPDYVSSLSAVFTEMTRQIICQAGTLDILCMGYRPTEDNPLKLPSWVEDFGDTIRTPSYTWNNETSGQYCAGGPLETTTIKHLDLSRGLSRITLQGYIVGEISFLGPVIPREGFTAKTACDIIQQSRPPNMVLERHYSSSGEDLEDAYWRTLVRNVTGKGKRLNESSFPEVQHAYQALRDSQGSKKDSADEHSSNVFVDAMRINWGYRLAGITSSLIGLVPGGAKLGNAVCILRGSIAGHILNLKAGKGGAAPEYSHVGAGYIHGLMYGEIETMRQEMQFSLQSFVLL